ncbi:kell blood group glycoprotein [Engraulis encrasicolus]|uniref:kell blood group glycoprotein n=1 Tax=Engraulis encrasicolus TaxID=184585 RepID=UPI002FD00E8B
MQSVTIEDCPTATQAGDPQCVWGKRVKVALGFAILATLIGLGLHSLMCWSLAAPPECLSPACLGAAGRLSAAVDPFARPCDYFLFTCGSPGAARGRQRGKGIVHHGNSGEADNLQRRGGRGAQTERMNDTLEDESLPDRETLLLQSIRNILETSEGRDSLEAKAKRFYRSCMNTRAIERQGSEPFLNLIQQVGGWPALGLWTETDLNSTLAVLMGQYGTFPFFSVYVGRDPNQDTDTPYIQIDQPDLQIPTQWDNQSQTSKSHPSVRAFVSTSNHFLTLLGVPAQSRAMHKGLYTMLASELAVKTSPLHHRQQANMLYRRLTIAELQTLAPVIDWLGCLQAAFHPLHISQSQTVLVHNLPYMVHMSETLSKWLQKNRMMGRDPIQTYMVLSLLYTLLPALDSRFRETQRNFSVALGNVEEEEPRWKHCVRRTEEGFDRLLSHMIQGQVAHKEADSLVRNLYSSFQKKLADLTRRDQEFGTIVLKRVMTLTPQFFPNTTTDRLTQLYSEVVISDENYFSNYLQSLLLQRQRRNQLYMNSLQPDLMSISPVLSGTDVIFPTGMFLPPLFHPTYPRALNYGGLGFMMAKDLLHLLLPDFHNQSDIPESVGACVWSKYISVTEGHGRVGAFVLSPHQKMEVWVHYTALQVALEAYQSSLQQQGSDSALKGMFHTHLFFTSFSQISCDPYPYRQLVTFEPSFLVSVMCAKPDLCPSRMTCQGVQLVGTGDGC